MKKSTLEHLLMGGRDRPMVSILDGTVTSTDPYLVLCTGEDEPGEVVPVGKGAVGDAVIVLCVGRRRLAFPGGASISLAKLTDGQLSAGVYASLRTQLAIPDPPAAPVDVPDTGWQNLTPATGYTATNAQWRVRDGWAMMRGRITAPEQWPASATYAVCATIPMQARPASPMVATASDHGGRLLGVALGSELSVINRLHSITPTSTIQLDSIPCWRVD